MTRDECKRNHPAFYWREIFAPQDTAEMIAAASAIAPVINLFTSEVVK